MPGNAAGRGRFPYSVDQGSDMRIRPIFGRECTVVPVSEQLRLTFVTFAPASWIQAGRDVGADMA